jgi:hypothetical protein
LALCQLALSKNINILAYHLRADIGTRPFRGPASARVAYPSKTGFVLKHNAERPAIYFAAAAPPF